MTTRAREMFFTIFLFAVFASAQGRAVNISNTWVLPEEGFPVFYRYFRDRISWYEADAVCQFHHANLVTVDTTAQYDAVRAYLKELDISSAVWVGLIRSNPDGDFTWTDYRGLSSDGYWSSAPDAQAAPLCAAADPAADYRWEAMSCGGPTVASFICELPVPQWALGNEGCMIRALPALTVLYLPESAAVQLTADCGLAGVKKVQCTGNVKRENLLKDLSCVEEVEPTSTINIISTASISSETTYTDQDATNDTATEDIFTTTLDIDSKPQIIETTSLRNLNGQTKLKGKTKSFDDHFNKIILEKSINFNLNNKDILQRNTIVKTDVNDNSLTDESASEKHDQQKLLNEELTRLGSLDTIYTQPTDHFVPPLVMAKARISDDMTVISLEEKHAQQFAEQHLSKHDENNSKFVINHKKDFEMKSTSNPIITTQIVDYVRKDKQNLPKKYNQKLDNPKTKLSKHLINKLTSEKFTSTTPFIETSSKPTTVIPKEVDQSEEVPSIDLTVIIKEPGKNNIEKIFYSNSSSLISKPDEILNSSEKLLLNVSEFSTNEPMTTLQENDTYALENITMNHEIVKITLINNDESGITNTFEITTKMPVFVKSEDKEKINVDTTLSNVEHSTKQSLIIDLSTQTPNTVEVTLKETLPTIIDTKSTETPASHKLTTQAIVEVENVSKSTEIPIASTSLLPNRNVSEISNSNELTTMPEILLVTDQEKNDIFNYTESFTQEDHEGTDTEPIDDADSPLLSAANEPLHRPNRSRRPIQPQRISKFNPFRILG